MDYWECVADDVKPGKVTSFPRSVKLKSGETVLFSWIVFKSRAHRDQVNAKVIADPRLAKMMDGKAAPFDGSRMIYGGFKSLVRLPQADPMTDRRLQITDEIHRYLVEHSVREPEVLARLRAATASLPQAQMQIGPEQGQLMALLAKLVGAKRCIEIGVFTGYSSLAVALALPEDGRILACDVSEEWTAIARRFWREAASSTRSS